MRKPRNAAAGTPVSQSPISLQRRLGERRAHDAVDHALDRAAGHGQETARPLAGQAEDCSVELSSPLGTVAKEEECREHAQTQLQHALAEADPRAQEQIATGLEVGMQCGGPARALLAQLLPVVVQRRAEQRQLGNPEGRPGQSLLEQRAHHAGDLGDIVGEARTDSHRRQHQHGGDQCRHRRGRQRPPATKCAQQPGIERPGRKRQDQRPEQGRKERPQHEETADREDQERADHDDLLDAGLGVHASRLRGEVGTP